MRTPGRRARKILVVVIALVVINLPYAVYQYRLHSIASDGVQVTATVVSASQAGDDVVLGLKFPASVDPDQPVRTARVSASAGAAATRAGEVDVRVLAGHPAVFDLDGQKRGHGSTIITLGADVLVLLLILLMWRLGGRIRRPALVAVALGDVEGGEEGSLLDKQVDGTYVINGEVTEAVGDSLVLALRERDVTVHLRGHANPIDVGAQAKVHAHLVG